ncbi:Os05g0541900 [Oryza sativa Japonica Group]|uniref:Os05g0541900 protein n=1 Tax=Oryza sativa subsp. japonica TaxID=39947 RepID=Q0DGB9_ORYSJ|nr:Os05g0541900 [Oryza sativa Japonica Group]|eukprot:NP_001056190.2 Os05g0541900 [Oryza sativa Japonica Group]
MYLTEQSSVVCSLICCYSALQVSDNYYRPDLTKPALARLSSVYRSLQVSKSGAKKKNRQPTKL